MQHADRHKRMRTGSGVGFGETRHAFVGTILRMVTSIASITFSDLRCPRIDSLGVAFALQIQDDAVAFLHLQANASAYDSIRPPVPSTPKIPFFGTVSPRQNDASMPSTVTRPTRSIVWPVGCASQGAASAKGHFAVPRQSRRQFGAKSDLAPSRARPSRADRASIPSSCRKDRRRAGSVSTAEQARCRGRRRVARPMISELRNSKRKKLMPASALDGGRGDG